MQCGHICKVSLMCSCSEGISSTAMSIPTVGRGNAIDFGVFVLHRN